MKAELNGIKLEGTPKEIFEFMELRTKTEKVKVNVDDWFKKPKKPFTYYSDVSYGLVGTMTVNPNLITETII